LLLCVWATPAAAQSARVSMSASASHVSVGEPFAVEIRSDVTGANLDDVAIPDFGKLQVLAQRVSRPFSFSIGFGSNGQHARMQSQVVHSYTLVAVAPGTYVIQPAIITVNGRKYASQRLSIEASGAALPQPPGPSGAAPSDPAAGGGAALAPPEGPLSGARFDNDLFLRSVVDKTRAYVGEQVTVTIYLYVRGGLSQNPSITREPTTEGFWVQDLLSAQQTRAPVHQTVNGRSFSAYVLRRYAAFPLRPGKLEIGAPAIELGAGNSLFDLLTGPAAPVRRDGVSVAVEVLPLPERKKPSGPTHVGSLSLEASAEPTQGKVGDAITLRLLAKGTGNLKGLKLPDPVLPGVEVLAPEIEDKLTNELDIIGGERVFRWLLLPRKPGNLSIPPFSVDVFDPAAVSFSSVRSQPLKLSITGAPAADLAPQPGNAAASTERANGSLSFGPARTESALARARPALSAAPWYPWAVLGGPLLLLASGAGRWLGARLRARRAGRPGDQALRNAEQKLRDAQAAAHKGESGAVYGAIVGALRAGLAARLDGALGGLTLQQLKAHCVERGMPPALAERLVSELESCEQARFDPSQQGSASLEARVARAGELLQQLARFSPRGTA
jgi:hypothetical protein